MPLRRFRRQYEQLSQFERGRIIGMMEAGWLVRRVACQLGHSGCNVRRCGDQWIREMSFTRRPGLGLVVEKTVTSSHIFQQDNARPQTARVPQDCLRTVTTLPWPVLSPDLSPIEPMWDHLGRRVGHPTSLNELEARLQQIWNEMCQDIRQNLYASMPNSIVSCIRARKVSTGY
ncbi:transposable element Tcb1 transposase [Trichonephila clavipes]|nr:transposable element Tcb1 transposase [Trichonephila clavipes]